MLKLDMNPSKFCQMVSMVDITGGRMAPFPGGVLLKSASGAVVGSVSVSGASGDEDEYCAIRGVLESKYSILTIPEEPSCTTVKDTVTFEIKQESSTEFEMDKYEIPTGSTKVKNVQFSLNEDKNSEMSTPLNQSPNK